MSLVGQVGLRQHAKPFTWGWAIEKETHSISHHSVIVVDETHCVSAQPGGAALVRIDSYPSLVYTSLPYVGDEGKKVAAAALEMIGRPYNYAALAVMGAEFTFGTNAPRWLDWLVTHNGALDCSGLCHRAIERGTGYSLFPKSVGLIWPGLFEQFVPQTTSYTPTPATQGAH